MAAESIQAAGPAIASAANTAYAAGAAKANIVVGSAVASAGLAVAVLPESVLIELLTSGVSVSCANTATNPLDVIKVRLQLARNKLPNGAKPPGMVRNKLAESVSIPLCHNGKVAGFHALLVYHEPHVYRVVALR